MLFTMYKIKFNCLLYLSIMYAEYFYFTKITVKSSDVIVCHDGSTIGVAVLFASKHPSSYFLFFLKV